MDRTIVKKPSPYPWLFAAVLVIAGTMLAVQLAARAGTHRLKVDAQRLTTAAVQAGEFLEYYPFNGRVEPAVSVPIEIQEGGRVEAILAEDGQRVSKGDLILRLSNAQAQRNTIETETRLLETLDAQRNTEFNRATSNLARRDSLLDMDHHVADLENQYRRYAAMMKTATPPMSALEFETMSNRLKYLREKRSLLAERIDLEETLSAKQLEMAQRSIARLSEILELLNTTAGALEVRAPIGGILSTIDAQVGETVGAGRRIGQVDQMDKLKLRLAVDQHYSDKVVAGTPGRMELDGRSWPVQVSKVFPEIRDGAFDADAQFIGEVPPNLKRGRTLPVELTFGDPEPTLIVSRGDFSRQTGGLWVYLVTPDGSGARRISVRLGRQNPREVEVLDGLREGDRIIISSYEDYSDADELRFTAPLARDGKS